MTCNCGLLSVKLCDDTLMTGVMVQAGAGGGKCRNFEYLQNGTRYQDEIKRGYLSVTCFGWLSELTMRIVTRTSVTKTKQHPKTLNKTTTDIQNSKLIAEL